MTNEITNTQDIIDSRDVIARIEDLESNTDALDEYEAEELANLKALADEAEGYAPDWKYGEALIRDSYFTTYAQDLAEDIGAIGRDVQWPLMHIDWDDAAEALKMDYAEVQFDGISYWIRC